MIAFAHEEVGDVAQIFALQRQRLIFRMSLEEMNSLERRLAKMSTPASREWVSTR